MQIILVKGFGRDNICLPKILQEIITTHDFDMGNID
jgi:hypothetical protein